MTRFVLHADMNAFYANVECLYRPMYRDKPLAVTGDPELRHGIILTKNQIAKKFGVLTGETIYEAKSKCPGLVLVTADYPLYMRFSSEFREILSSYSNQVEAYGLDEAWVDISAPEMTWEKAKAIADEIRERAKFELGITASIGASWTKPFAKLGSDLKKPDATTVITPENYWAKVWPLPASELLFVGPATTKLLAKHGVYTIGDLAYTAVLQVGDRVYIEGRLQSRTYQKQFPDGKVVDRVAYEVSAWQIDRVKRQAREAAQ